MFEQTIWALIVTALDIPFTSDWIDQHLHMTWIIVCMLPLIFKRNVFTFTLTGFLFCLPRELIDQGNLLSGKMFGMGKVTDIVFFTLGGLIVGILHDYHKHICKAETENAAIRSNISKI